MTCLSEHTKWCAIKIQFNSKAINITLGYENIFMNETSLDNAQVLSSCRNTLCVISISIIEYIFLKSPGTQKKTLEHQEFSAHTNIY